MQRYGKPSPYRYGSLSNRGSLALRQQPRYANVSQGTVTEIAKTTLDPEAVRARARLLAIAAMDDLDARRSSMEVSEIVDTLNAAGRLTGAQAATVQHSGSIGHLHLDALRQLSAERRLSNSSGASATVSAKLLPNPSDGNVLDVVPEDSASLGQESDGGEVPE